MIAVSDRTEWSVRLSVCSRTAHALSTDCGTVCGRIITEHWIYSNFYFIIFHRDFAPPVRSFNPDSLSEFLIF